MPGMHSLLAVLVLVAGLTTASHAGSPAKDSSNVDSLGASRDGVSHGRTTEARLMEHLLGMSKALPSGVVAARGAVGDLAYPRDSAETSAMGGYGLLMVTAVTRNALELPLLAVRVRTANGDLSLQRVGRRRTAVAHPEVLRLFGQYRGDELFYFPVAFTRLPCTVVVDFAANRTNLEVMRFPPPPDADGWPKDRAVPEPGTPDPEAAAALARREFGWAP